MFNSDVPRRKKLQREYLLNFLIYTSPESIFKSTVPHTHTHVYTYIFISVSVLSCQHLIFALDSSVCGEVFE